MKSDVPLVLRIEILGYEIGRASGTWIIVPLVPRIEFLGYEIGRASGT